VFEEVGIAVSEADLTERAELTFLHPDAPARDFHVRVYTATRFTGTPEGSAEMEPEWFEISNLPWKQMWVSDKLWLPQVLRGEKLTGTFYFDGDMKTVTRHEIVTKL
jgi:8-oxo-dGTP diphosphatase